MEEIKKFSPEVCGELKYYVYRLIDPRNGKTFYIGKGKGNRVFAHVNNALENYDGENYLSREEDDTASLKIKKIREIKDSGLDVIYVIQKYGLKERDALIIESVLIDVFSLNQKLTNKIKGFNSDIEPTNAITLERDLSKEEYVDSPNNPNYIIIKVKDYWLNERNNDRYETTRSAWKINIDKALNYPYVLSVTNGVVKAVYKVSDWHESTTMEGRNEFTGTEAEQDIKDIFLNKRIPEKYRKKGMAGPCIYCKLDNTTD